MDFLSVAGEYTAERTIEKSRFLSYVAHTAGEEEARAFLDRVRKEHPLATHVCWAYISDRLGNLQRFSDDGEPQGTAGMPILDVLRHENLVDVCCVVTRYFGGVLLGTGGLVRAYTQGAQIAVAAAGVQRMSLYTVALIACPYNLLGVVQQILPEQDCTTEDIDYGADVTLTVVQPVGGLDALNQALADATAGTVYAEPMEVSFRGRRVK